MGMVISLPDANVKDVKLKSAAGEKVNIQILVEVAVTPDDIGALARFLSVPVIVGFKSQQQEMFGDDDYAKLTTK